MALKSAKKVVNLWRKVNSDKLMIIGGPIASDSNLLKKIKCNIAVKGQGEKKLTYLLKVLIKNSTNLIGKELNIKITQVLSDKSIEGKIIKR